MPEVPSREGLERELKSLNDTVEVAYLKSDDSLGVTSLRLLGEGLLKSGYIYPSLTDLIRRLETLKAPVPKAGQTKAVPGGHLQQEMSRWIADVNTFNEDLPSLSLSVKKVEQIDELVISGVALQSASHEIVFTRTKAQAQKPVRKPRRPRKPRPAPKKRRKVLVTPDVPPVRPNIPVELGPGEKGSPGKRQMKHGKPNYDIDWIERQSQRIYNGMEEKGFRVDMDVLSQVEAENTAALSKTLDEIESMTGVRPRPASAEESAEMLATQGIRAPKTQKGKTSVTMGFLSRLHNPAADLLIKARKQQRLASTAKGVARRSKDGRVHPSYVMTPELGRPHAKGVNYMNWTEDLQSSVMPEDGHYFAVVDFKTAELRILAVLANEPHMLSAFKEGRDLHREVAGRIFKKPPEEVTDKERSFAKAISFGIPYGMESYGLSKRLDISEDEAQGYLDDYFATHPKIREFQEESLRLAREKGEVETFHGRKRDMKKILREDPEKAARLATSHRAQSTAGDIMRIGLVNLSRELGQEGGFVLGTVHDSYLLSVPVHVTTQRLEALARDAVIDQNEPDFPLDIDIAVGDRWTNLKKI